MAILVLGGAGYIGSHTVKQLYSEGHEVIILDNLVHGHKELVIDICSHFYEGDFGNTALLEHIFNEHDIEIVIHFAAFAYVGESINNPSKYYINNFSKGISLLDSMVKFSCRKIIFSSTCATYGEAQYLPIDELHQQEPINPYGKSKYFFEQALEDYDHAFGLKHVCLRYFNASGASSDGTLGEWHEPETHLIPLALLAALGRGDELVVFGNDYDTIDGSCMRDYIHVEDLAKAHIKGMDYLNNGKDSLKCNLGTGQGISVLQIIKSIKNLTGLDVQYKFGPRRPGDPSELIASPEKARKELNWIAEKSDINNIIESSYRWILKLESLI